MKKGTVHIIVLFLFFLFVNQKINAQYKNDSAAIFSILNKTNKIDIDYINKADGLERHYRKIKGKWLLAWITYSENNKWIWSCKVGKYADFDFSIDLINLNNEVIKDSMDIFIPYENAKIWMKIAVREKNILGMVTYYQNGNLMQEYLHYNKNGDYKEYYLNGKIKIHRQGDFFTNNKLIKGDEFIYNEDGNLLIHNMIDLTNYK
jgi:antitoxin component YwqK of YwqJK toxin-antitoxin module